MRGRLLAVGAIGMLLLTGAALSAGARGLPAFVAADIPGLGCPRSGHAGSGLLALQLPFELDYGRLTVSRPERGTRSVPADQARSEFLSTEEVAGPHQCVGFGLASVRTRPTTVGPASPARLAWVGLAANVGMYCPITTGDVTPVPLPINAVIIDAVDPHSVSVYTSRGSYCDEPPVGPSIRPAHQVISVAFEVVDPRTIAYDMPSCGHRVQDSGAAGSDADHDLVVWVHIAIPFADAACPSRHVVEEWGLSMDGGLTAAHAPVGPVPVLNNPTG